MHTVKHEFLNTREPLIYSSLCLSFVVMWSPHTHDPDPGRWSEAHTVSRPPPGVTHPLSQDKETMPVVSGPPMCKQARSLSLQGPWKEV